MKLLILLIGLVFILEGLPYAASPESMQRWLLKLSQLSPQQLRVMGCIAMGIGLLICWLVQKTDLFN